MTEWIWIFHGEGAQMCTAVFTDLERAGEWIKWRDALKQIVEIN